jgi:thiamine transporter
MSQLKFDTKILAEMAVTVALSVVLDYIKIFHLPQGGSVTLGSMVPILFISYGGVLK